MLPKFTQNQRVGWRELKRRKFVLIDPADRLRSEWTRFSRKPAAGEEADENPLVRIFVLDLVKGRDNFDIRAQLFANLADGTRLERLARLKLSAGKLPISAQMIFRPPPCDEEPTLPENECRRDPDDSGNCALWMFGRR